MSDRDWNPEQYLKFAGLRLRPARELLERVPLASPRVVCDLGCGTGNVTRIIAERWPDAKIMGIDNSAAMLGEARETPGRIEWVEADIENWSPADAPDLVFSNAALHWVDDHEAMFPRLLGMLTDGGCLAVQMPLSDDLPAIQLIRESLAHCVGDEAASTIQRSVGEPEDYDTMLAPGARHVEIWTVDYEQELEGDDAVYQWVKGTALVPVLAGLDEAQSKRFIDDYRQRLREAYPRGDDGVTLYPFRRLFLIATR